MWLWDWIRDALYSIADFWEDFGDDLGKIPLIGETLESWCDYVADWWNYLGDRADDMSAIMDDVMRTTLDFPDWETIRDRIEDTWAWLTWSASDFVNWIKSALENTYARLVWSAEEYSSWMKDAMYFDLDISGIWSNIFGVEADVSTLDTRVDDHDVDISSIFGDITDIFSTLATHRTLIDAAPQKGYDLVKEAIEDLVRPKLLGWLEKELSPLIFKES